MRRSRRTPVLGLLGLAAAAAASVPIIAFAGPGAEAPNLRADPVEGIEGPSIYSGTEGGLGDGALLVRFDGFVTNVGQGPLEVRGNPQIAGNVRQFARTGPSESLPSVPVGTPEVRFEGADSHNHWHLMRAMRYSLWNLQRTAQVAPSQKVGFCLYDIEPASSAPVTDPKTYTASVTNFCEATSFGGGGAGATSLRMGTSPGWRDVYDKGLAYQWVNVSNTSPGTYLVGAEADPDNVIWEGGGTAENNTPAFASQQVTVPGWVAQPVAVNQTGAAQVVPVAATKFGTQSNSALRYRVVSAPSNGTLNLPVGAVFAAGQLQYTPAPGYGGSDSFAYAAFSASSSFPTNPPAATVSVNGAAPSITLSGAPASLVAGTSAQLTAALANAPGGVSWSAGAGTISPTGLYVAPGTPPPGGTVTVRAASTANPAVAAEAVIAITPAPSVVARPGVGGSPLRAGSKLISPLRVVPFGRRIVVSKIATGRKAGRVVISVTIGPKLLGRCVARKVGARKTFTCKVTMKKPYALKKVRVTAKFTATKGGATAVRRTFAAR